MEDAVGRVLGHDITEIRQGEFKGRAFKKGHVITADDIEHLKRLGKNNIYLLEIDDDSMHENDAAFALAHSLVGTGVEIEGEPKEGKINLLAGYNGLLKVDKHALYNFNLVGEVMCATLHTNTVVTKGQTVAGVRAIPLVVKKAVVERAVSAAKEALQVRRIRKARAGVVITGSEVYTGKIEDKFLPIVQSKIERFGGEVIGSHLAPDDASFIAQRLRGLIDAGADLLVVTGGLSVDPDDVTRFAVKMLDVTEMHYGAAVLPGSMFVIAYVEGSAGLSIPILCIPACGMYNGITIFDLVLPRILASEHIGREELADMGHGGLCLQCKECRYPVCPFGK
ncbi:molybdopterin biosynthesis protein [Candidatus Magnetobacterium bavaricum]|uniref:Molybdopterin molybdenumtransferase n=1 Tax=Candidatus Magnetobacterium bavaricum TaxID=29290 RepID=A0A0F3GIQ4_9BACT|nr:molybdopterin biosynthesis protein [Candidatus Magnetobacterium bavaricum]